jgi:probable addiction module antidote protein
MEVTISDYQGTDYLETDEDIKEYLNASFATGDSKLIARALGDVAKVKGMSAVARSTKLNRSSLYDSLSKEGDPKLSTVTKLIKTFGYSVSVK